MFARWAGVSFTLLAEIDAVGGLLTVLGEQAADETAAASATESARASAGARSILFFMFVFG
jgi:hypothetical protein